MRKAFLEFLTRGGVLPRDKMETVLRCMRAAPEPIGSIAFGYGLISCDDIDAILDEQRESHRPFGEIAIRRGLLTPARVETLLHVQQVRAAAEVAEALALSGLCPIQEVVERLGEFLKESARTRFCTEPAGAGTV